MQDRDPDRELAARMSNARTVMSNARMGIRQTEKDIKRFEELEKAYKYVREHGADITVSVRFGASRLTYAYSSLCILNLDVRTRTVLVEIQ